MPHFAESRPIATTTISVASFQTAVAEVADAIASSDRGGAYSWYGRAEAIHAGLELEMADEGSSLKRRESLNGLSKALDKVFKVIGQTSGTSRFISTRTGHGSR